MQAEKSFGIGCFNFGVRQEPPFEFKGSDYIKHLKGVLSKIPNLNNLKVNFEEEFENEVEQITERLPNLQNEGGYFPCPSFFDIQFELYIPFRIQAELCRPKKNF